MGTKDTLDQVLDELSSRRSKGAAGRVQRGRAVLMALFAVLAACAPAYLFLTPVFGMPENNVVLATVTAVTAALLVGAYRKSADVEQQRLVERRRDQLAQQLQSVGKLECEQAFMEALEEAAVMEATAYALWVNNLAFLLGVVTLACLVLPRVLEDPDSGDDEVEFAGLVNYGVSLPLSALLVFAF